MNDSKQTDQVARSLQPPVQPREDVVLFLDVDGVLNQPGTPEKSPHGTYGVEPEKAERVRRIVRETGAHIVVCSTWRRYRDMLHYLFQSLGPECKERWIGVTPILDKRTESGLFTGVVRGDEIQDWLNRHPEVTRFAILDDDQDMKHLTPHLFRTHCCEGLTDEIAVAVIERLNTKAEG